jgi:hypothetical protein
VLFEKPAHREFTGRRKFNKFALSIEEQSAGVCAESFDVKRLFRVSEITPQGLDRDAVLSSQRTKNMSFDQVRKGEQGRMARIRSDQWGKVAVPRIRRILAAERPGA